MLVGGDEERRLDVQAGGVQERNTDERKKQRGELERLRVRVEVRANGGLRESLTTQRFLTSVADSLSHFLRMHCLFIYLALGSYMRYK